MAAKNVLGKISKLTLKSRMWNLLLLGSILPLILLFVLVSFIFFNMYQKNVEQTIYDELEQMNSTTNILMDGMRYMSQQLIDDNELISSLTEYETGTSAQHTNAIMYINDRIRLYHASNPNVNNITIFNSESKKNINHSLITGNYVDESLLLSRQNQISFYGPHNTRSMVSHYPVISLVRKVPGFENLYIYIESGYKNLGEFSAVTLDRLNAVYTVVSDEGKVVYSSNESYIQSGTIAAANTKNVSLNGEKFSLYEIKTNKNWALQVYVSPMAYNKYIITLALGLVLIVLAAVILSVVLGSLMWSFVNRPLMEFQNSLQSIMQGDVKSGIKEMQVREFDESVKYFENMRQQILQLIEEATKNENEKAQLEIRLVMYKINPHFLHNTLNTLKWYACEHGYHDIEEFIASLNRLLMYNMEKESKTTLASEVESIDNYMELQKIKYDIVYNYECNIPKEMLNCKMPRFVLYPLVENAILHGVKGNGKIRLCINLHEDGRICIKVCDSGTPLTKAKISEIQANIKNTNSRGIGLPYVDKAVGEFFEGQGEFKITNENNENVFSITAPFLLEEAYEKSFDC